MEDYKKNEYETKFGWACFVALIFIVATVCFATANQHTGEERDTLQEENYSLQEKVDGLQSSLDEANEHIGEANEQIESASGVAWEDYDTMGNALESLNTVDTVSY